MSCVSKVNQLFCECWKYLFNGMCMVLDPFLSFITCKVRRVFCDSHCLCLFSYSEQLAFLRDKKNQVMPNTEAVAKPSSRPQQLVTTEMLEVLGSQGLL